MQSISDEEFEQQFKSCEFDPHQFSHRAHLRLAYVHIRKYGLEEAIRNLCLQIAIYDRTHDEGIKYHETITIVAARIMDHFMNKQTSEGFDALLEEFPALEKDFMGLINQHYSINLFTHPTAKIEYLEPDLRPFG